ncbi:uncharacterized protein LOC117179713 [Belonocnema kinseyi]|uniref:uncharacterized protein LOC117179713 n=1 Tax=Belonocnema kinseyi TaxID=2817044 RepID=UPI00143CF3DF|nr:uncharacterized protein LOC117179713 [Belonocnema kinseyi]
MNLDEPENLDPIENELPADINAVLDFENGEDVEDSDTSNRRSSDVEESSSMDDGDSNGHSTDSENDFIEGIIKVLKDEPDEVRQLRVLAVTKGIKQDAVDGLLKILRRRTFPQSPKSAKTFLGTSSSTYEIKEMMDCNGTVGEYVYFEIEKGLQECIDPDVYRKATIFYYLM